MNPIKDLRSTRLEKGLRIADLASPWLRVATVSEIENGKRCPRRKTREKIESIIGPIDWRRTLAANDRDHLILKLIEFINEDGPGNPRDRIKYCKQVLVMLEETLND